MSLPASRTATASPCSRSVWRLRSPAKPAPPTTTTSTTRAVTTPSPSKERQAPSTAVNAFVDKCCAVPRGLSTEKLRRARGPRLRRRWEVGEVPGGQAPVDGQHGAGDVRRGLGQQPQAALSRATATPATTIRNLGFAPDVLTTCLPCTTRGPGATCPGPSRLHSGARRPCPHGSAERHAEPPPRPSAGPGRRRRQPVLGAGPMCHAPHRAVNYLVDGRRRGALRCQALRRRRAAGSSRPSSRLSANDAPISAALTGESSGLNHRLVQPTIPMIPYATTQAGAPGRMLPSS